MAFWITLIVGAVAALIGVKKGLYCMWVVLFNILIAIYLSVMLTPIVITAVEDIGETYYHHAICVAVLSVVVFTILQIIATSFIAGTYEITFPQVFEKITSGIFGFVSGYLVCSFVFFIVCIMPLPDIPIVKSFASEKGLAPTAVASVTKACNFVGSISLQCSKTSVPAAIAKLIDRPAEPEEIDLPDETE